MVDAEGKTAGHLATAITNILRGRNKATYTPHIDLGDYVVVINVEKIVLTGNKDEQKEYFNHSDYMGHLKSQKAKVVREKNPGRIIRDAVAGMMPKNRMRREQLERLYLYAGPEHPHSGQNPTPINL